MGIDKYSHYTDTFVGDAALRYDRSIRSVYRMLKRGRLCLTKSSFSSCMCDAQNYADKMWERLEFETKRSECSIS